MIVDNDHGKYAPNQTAHLLLNTLITRVELRKTEFLDQLAALGHPISDDTFTNWGRSGRAFPRDWALLRAMLRIVSNPHLRGHCTPDEALRFCALVGMPFAELPALAALFPPDGFDQALLPYLPRSLATRITGTSIAGPHAFACPAMARNVTCMVQYAQEYDRNGGDGRHGERR